MEKIKEKEEEGNAGNTVRALRQKTLDTQTTKVWRREERSWILERKEGREEEFIQKIMDVSI